MIAIEGAYIELHAEDPERLATFYERLVGLERLETVGGSIALGRGGLIVRIKPALDDPTDASAVFGFELPANADFAACREEAVAAGAVVLSESKRGAMRLLACQDPAGNEFVLMVRSVEAPLEALVPIPRDAARDAAPDVAPPAAPPLSTAPRRVTRRDVDQLRDMERLAAMQEAIAGLAVPFTPDDPATVISEMQSKIGPVDAHDAKVAEADALLRAREREAAVDDMLARYRAQVAPPEEAPPRPVDAPKPATDDDVERELPRTLGRSQRKDDDE
jgi:predicted enzyme related to lactoylglutathione lyase